MGRRKITTKISLSVTGVLKGNGVTLEGEEEALKGNGEALKGNRKTLICNEQPSKADADA